MSAAPDLFQEMVGNISRWYGDPVGFVREVIHAEPTAQQTEFLNAIAENRSVAARSGHGPGKSTSLAWAILWFSCTRWKPRIPCTAPSAHQLHDILWAELSKWFHQMPTWFSGQFELTTDRFFHKVHRKEWFAVARTARKEDPEALQGFHGEHLLFVIEEASGVEDAIFGPVEGVLTGEDVHVVMAGNPTRPRGFFYDAFHKQREQWKTLKMSSLDSPLVDKNYGPNLAKKYGPTSNIYRVRVLGEFPKQEDDVLIPLEWCEAAGTRYLDVQGEGPVRMGVDVGRFGDDPSAFVIRQGRKVWSVEDHFHRDTMKIAGLVVQALDRFEEQHGRPVDEIDVDTIGLGAGVADRLREVLAGRKHPPRIVDADVSRATDCAVVGREFNTGRRVIQSVHYSAGKPAGLRDQLWLECRDWLETAEPGLPDDEGLIGELSTPLYSLNSKGQIVVESKADMKKRGVSSPNKADALNLTFYPNREASGGSFSFSPNIDVRPDP